MIARTRRLAAVLAVLLALPAPPGRAQPPDEAPGERYQPLFSEEMIRRAPPEHRERMRAVEAQHRAAFERRRREQAQAPGARGGADAQAAPSDAPPAARRGRTRVYKWVDEQGRVHFGDAPEGRGAEEIEVGGAARIQGTPPPPPGSTSSAGGERD